MEASTDATLTQRDIKVREVTHYQFSWTGTEPGQPGVFSLQVILDQGAKESVFNLTPDDADVLQELLRSQERVYFDIERQVLMFGVNAV